MSWWRRVTDSIAFSLGYVASDAAHEAEFESTEARQSRYVQYWAAYENQAYSKAHTWATSYKHQYALSKHIRNLFDAGHRLGEFYGAHLWGGALDREAGEEGAIPIVTENGQLRMAIAELWRRSNMATLKDVIALRGCIEGDVFLQVIDDIRKQRIYLARLDPGLVTGCSFDYRGNVKAYTVEETRDSPGGKSGTARYKLVVSRSGDNVVYQTYLNDKPYGWDGQPAEWSMAYTFVPLVLIKHKDVGLEWGHSELHAIRSKVHEADDIASMIGDYIGKHLHPRFLGKGGTGNIATKGATKNETGNTDTRPEPGREELDIMWTSNANASIEAIIADLDLENSLAYLKSLNEAVERECPELQTDIWASGATSGRALRVARQRVEAQVLQRREGYDSGLVRAHKMAVAIGGMQKYSGYEGFSLDSYEKGDLDHNIAPRPVFEPDPMDDVEAWQARLSAIKTGTEAGLPVEGILRSMELPEDTITEFMKTEIVEEEQNDG